MGNPTDPPLSLKSHDQVVLPPQITHRISGVAIVLRTQPFGESDLIVDLFTETIGKISVVAKGALRSKKRYMGTLEIGNRIKVDFLKKSQLSVLGDCDIINPIWHTRQDLERIANLNYLLEVTRLNMPLQEADDLVFESLCHCLDLLESGHFTAESLAIWDLSMMKRMGYDLSFQKCPYTQCPPDGLSLKAGGTVSAKSNLPYYPVPIEALRILYQLKKGQLVQFHTDHILAVRLALGGIWGDICQNRLQSLSFFNAIYLILIFFCFCLTACSSHHSQEDDQTIAELSSNKQKTKFKNTNGAIHEENRDTENRDTENRDTENRDTENQDIGERLSLSDLEKISTDDAPTDLSHQQLESLPKIDQDQLKTVLAHLDDHESIMIDLEFQSDLCTQTIQCALIAKSAGIILHSFVARDHSAWEVSRVMPRLMVELKAKKSFHETLDQITSSLSLHPQTIDMKSGDLFWHGNHQNLIILEKPAPWHLDEMIYLGHCQTLEAIRIINRTPILEGHTTALKWQISLLGLQAK